MRSPRVLTPGAMAASGLCIGCGGCVASGGGARMDWSDIGLLEPRHAIPVDISSTCPFSPTARDEDELAAGLYPQAAEHDPLIGRFEAAYVGSAAEPGFRETGSSGGMVSWMAAELLRRGVVDGVAHVVACDPRREDRLFRYAISRTEAQVRAGAKSRYYPVELSAVIDEIRRVPGRYAIVGIPCFIKAVNLLRLSDPVIAERVVATLGLFCGHMKSARMVESFAWQMGANPGEVGAIDYRVKDPSRPANWYRAELALADGSRRQQDWWHLVDGDWGAGFFQSAACDYCDDVVAETADVSFGDAWVEPYSSDGRGTNVVVVRSPELHRLLRHGMEEGRVNLAPVDAAFVAGTQAAGFRHRREGLAWRLARRHGAVLPRKRVLPGSVAIGWRRGLVYRMRRHIARWSHRAFRLARGLQAQGIYTRWASTVLAVYRGLAYSRGPLGRVFDRVEAIGQRARRANRGSGVPSNLG